jgi:hypothetical protein
MWGDESMAKAQVCPECDHEFPHGWDGIDSHWESKHNTIMRYEEAWPLIWSGKYKRKDRHFSREDFSQAAARIVKEATEER